MILLNKVNNKLLSVMPHYLKIKVEKLLYVLNFIVIYKYPMKNIISYHQYLNMNKNKIKSLYINYFVYLHIHLN